MTRKVSNTPLGYMQCLIDEQALLGVPPAHSPTQTFSNPPLQPRNLRMAERYHSREDHQKRSIETLPSPALERMRQRPASRANGNRYPLLTLTPLARLIMTPSALEIVKMRRNLRSGLGERKSRQMRRSGSRRLLPKLCLARLVSLR